MKSNQMGESLYYEADAPISFVCVCVDRANAAKEGSGEAFVVSGALGL